MASTETTLDEVAAAIAAGPDFDASDVHVIKDKVLGDGTLIEDAIAQSLEDSGRCVVIRIDTGANPFPNVPGPQMDPTMVVEVQFDQGHAGHAEALRYFAEKAAALVHQFVPTNGRAIFAQAGQFMQIIEDEGLLIAQMLFTPPSGAS